MTDKELMEAAAKAMGEKVPPRFYADGSALLLSGRRWSPLTDNGDALRLAVKLHMTVRCYMGNTVAQIGTPGQRNAYEEATDHADPAAATRRAIVQAAAAVVEAPRVGAA